MLLMLNDGINLVYDMGEDLKRDARATLSFEPIRQRKHVGLTTSACGFKLSTLDGSADEGGEYADR